MSETGLTVYKTEAPTGESVREYELLLSEQALFLEPLSDQLSAKWSNLYLTTFGRGAFFSAQRVQKIFKGLTDTFIQSLKTKNLDTHFLNLQEHGMSFARLGVPFEEVIISIHLFEEACLEQFLDHFPQKTRLSDCLLALEELHSEGLATLASSYFETAKEELSRMSEGLREENETLQKELTSAKGSLFSVTQKELASMQLMLSGINQKLKNRVYQLARAQKISDALDGDLELTRLLRIASHQLLTLCPPNSYVYFGFFDDHRAKINLFHQETKESLECDWVKTFFFSELPHFFQESLYDESKKITILKSSEELPATLRQLLSLRNQREYLLLSLRKSKDVIGFVLASTPTEDFFTKHHLKFYQRVGNTLSKAISHSLLAHQVKQQEQYIKILEDLQIKHTSGFSPFQTIEETLNRCLGSLIELMGAERSSLMRFDPHTKELRVFAAKGYKVYPIAGLPIKWGEGVAGLALKEDRVISISRMEEPSNKKHLLKRLLEQKDARRMNVKSLLCLPLYESETPLGVINISTINFYKNFAPSEIHMAHQVVNRVATLVGQLSDMV